MENEDQSGQQGGQGDPTTEEQLESTQRELAAAQEKLKELEDKQQGLKAMRREAGSAKEEAKAAEAEKAALAEKVDTLNKRFDEYTTAQVTEEKKGIMRDLCGDDEEMQKKVDFEFAQLNTQTATKEELRAKYEKAYFMATGRQITVNPLNVGIPSMGAGFSAPSKSEELGMKPEVLDLANKLGLQYPKLAAKK